MGVPPMAQGATAKFFWMQRFKELSEDGFSGIHGPGSLNHPEKNQIDHTLPAANSQCNG